MSAIFIVKYAGAPILFPDTESGNIKLASESEATPFTEEGDAWLAANRAGLPAHHVTVVNLHARQSARAILVPSVPSVPEI